MPIVSPLEVLPALPEVIGVIAAMTLLMVGVFRPEGGVAATLAASRLVTVLALGSLLLILILTLTRDPGMAFGGLFVVDDFAQYFKVFILVMSALSLIMARDYLQRHNMARFEFAVLVVFATIGMMIMVSANDLISLYVGLEMQSLALYVLAAFNRDELRSSEAGLKYFVLGAVASCLLLYGSSLVYGFVGATSFDALGAALAGYAGEGAAAPPVGLVAGVVFILAGLAFKVSAVPFHMWAPDVYEGAPTPVTAFFSVAPKLAAMGLLVRVLLDPFGPLAGQWQQIVVLISIASMVLGAFAAITQSNIKRLMAYSSISHVGYALMGVAAGTQQGVEGVIVYMTIYVFMNIGAFACILGMRRHDVMVENLSDLAGLSRSHPRMAIALAVFMFSMAGIPPLAGFFGKLLIFYAAVDAGLMTLAVIGVLSSVFACYYYIRIVKIMYFEEAAEPLDRHIGADLSAVMAAACILILFFFLVPGPVMSGASAAAASLFGG